MSDKELRDEQNGVRWSSERDGSNVIHHMKFNSCTLSGAWVGARWIFHVLVSMSPGERASLASLDFDECMGEFRARLRR